MAPIELWPQGIKALWIQTTGWQARLLHVCIRWRVWVTPHFHRQDDGAHTGILIEIACCLLSSRFWPSLNYSVSAELQKVFAEWEQSQDSKSSWRLRKAEEKLRSSDFNPDFKQDSLFSTTCTSQTGWVMLHQLTKPCIIGLKCPFYFINRIIIITNITSNVFPHITIYSILDSCLKFMFNTTIEYLSICCYTKSWS